MKENIKTTNYIDKELKSESYSDSDNNSDIVVILLMKNKFESLNQIITQ